jgi:hypothetical protein
MSASSSQVAANAAAGTPTPGAPGTKRHTIGNLFRRTGNKIVSTGNLGPSGTGYAGGQLSLNGQVDLSTPLRGFRFVIKGRVTIGTAAYTSINPESILNLISSIVVTGTNTRQGGNVTLLSMDLATLFAMPFLSQWRDNYILLSQAAGALTLVPAPSFPYANIIPVTAQTNDFVIVVDMPFAPWGVPGVFESGFLMRDSEWTNAVNFTFKFPAVPDNSANPLGTSAATTVTTFSAFQSATGNITVDVYELPVLMGNARNSVTPGILTRSTVPINTILQNTATAALLYLMDKQRTTRVYVKAGVAAASPVFTSLNDVANLTALGIQVGTDRNVRNIVDIFACKGDMVDVFYNMGPIQGYTLLDFLGRVGNFDSAYPGDKLGSSSTFRLVGNVTGVANAGGLIVQEEVIQLPQGSLFG